MAYRSPGANAYGPVSRVAGARAPIRPTDQELEEKWQEARKDLSEMLKTPRTAGEKKLREMGE